MKRMSTISGLNKDEFEYIATLDRAAFLVMQGAVVRGFAGKYWTSCKVVLMVTKEMLDSTRDKRVYYDKYMKVRKKIKARMYLTYNPHANK